ncbi:MAG: hypothetical protein AB7T63_14835 [Planctomycetota bacterium]
MRTCLLVLVAALAAPVLPAAAPGPAEAAPRTRLEGAALLRALERQRLSDVRFQDATLDSVVRWLRIATGQNIVVKTTVLAKADIDLDAIRFNVELADVSVANLLRLILQPHGLTAVVKQNIIFITTIQDSYGRPVTRMYGIAHITWQKVDFHAPPLDLRPSNFVPVEEYEPEVPVEDDPLTDAEGVIELVTQMVEPEGWAANDDWSISGTRRYLLVRAPASVHRKIPRALAEIASMK